MPTDDDLNQYLPNAETMAEVMDPTAAREKIEKIRGDKELIAEVAALQANPVNLHAPRPAEASERVEYLDSKTIPPNNDKQAPRITQQKIKVSPGLLDPRAVVTQPKMATPTREQLAAAEARLEAEQAAALPLEQAALQPRAPEEPAPLAAWQPGPKPKLMTMKVKTAEPFSVGPQAAPHPNAPPAPDAPAEAAPVVPAAEPPGPWAAGSKAKLVTAKMKTVEPLSPSSLSSARADETTVREPPAPSRSWVVPAVVVALLALGILAWAKLHGSEDAAGAPSAQATAASPSIPTATAAPRAVPSVEPTTSPSSLNVAPSVSAARPVAPSIASPPEVSAPAPKSTTVQPATAPPTARTPAAPPPTSAPTSGRIPLE